MENRLFASLARHQNHRRLKVALASPSSRRSCDGFATKKDGLERVLRDRIPVKIRACFFVLTWWFVTARHSKLIVNYSAITAWFGLGRGPVILYRSVELQAMVGIYGTFKFHNVAFHASGGPKLKGELLQLGAWHGFGLRFCCLPDWRKIY